MNVWICCPSVCQQLVVNLFVLFQGNSLGVIINPNQDTEHIRFQIEGVLLPSLFEVQHCIATDTSVKKSEVQLRRSSTVFRGDDELISVSENMIGVLTSTSITISDGVSLKQNSRVFFEDRDGLIPRFSGALAKEMR